MVTGGGGGGGGASLVAAAGRRVRAASVAAALALGGGGSGLGDGSCELMVVAAAPPWCCSAMWARRLPGCARQRECHPADGDHRDQRGKSQKQLRQPISALRHSSGSTFGSCMQLRRCSAVFVVVIRLTGVDHRLVAGIVGLRPGQLLQRLRRVAR